ncbi:MAG TPA: hypothetical protein VGI81_20275 [Tepidisphaeraceae bacterium]|jgi:cytochrome c-type biogenesis protein CcmH/NrfF
MSSPVHTLPASSLDPRGIDPQSSLVRVLAVAGVIFGCLGMSCLPFNFGEFITYGWPVQARQAPLDWWVLAWTFVGLGLSTILLFSSLGAYHFKLWGFYGMFLWAVGSIGYGVLGIFFWVRWLLPWQRGEYVRMRGPDEVSGLIAWMVGTGLAVIVLRCLIRRDVRGVFAAPVVPSDDEVHSAHA